LGTAFQIMGKQEVSFMDWIKAIGALQEPGTGIPTQAFLRYYKYIVPEKTNDKSLSPSDWNKKNGGTETVSPSDWLKSQDKTETESPSEWLKNR